MIWVMLFAAWLALALLVKVRWHKPGSWLAWGRSRQSEWRACSGFYRSREEAEKILSSYAPDLIKQNPDTYWGVTRHRRPRTGLFLTKKGFRFYRVVSKNDPLESEWKPRKNQIIYSAKTDD